MTLQSDVPVLNFFEEDEIFWCVIDYPDNESRIFDLGSNYDIASETYLSMVETYRFTITKNTLIV